LVRLVLKSGARVKVDLEAMAGGRGAYVHRDRRCLEQAMARGGLERAFRQRVQHQELAEMEGVFTQLLENQLEGKGS
jgi:predicted RNA-binding protein YlxR (DUF448 family)